MWGGLGWVGVRTLRGLGGSWCSQLRATDALRKGIRCSPHHRADGGHRLTLGRIHHERGKASWRALGNLRAIPCRPTWRRARLVWRARCSRRHPAGGGRRLARGCILHQEEQLSGYPSRPAWTWDSLSLSAATQSSVLQDLERSADRQTATGVSPRCPALPTQRGGMDSLSLSVATLSWASQHIGHLTIRHRANGVTRAIPLAQLRGGDSLSLSTATQSLGL